MVPLGFGRPSAWLESAIAGLAVRRFAFLHLRTCRLGLTSDAPAHERGEFGWGIRVVLTWTADFRSTPVTGIFRARRHVEQIGLDFSLLNHPALFRAFHAKRRSTANYEPQSFHCS